MNNSSTTTELLAPRPGLMWWNILALLLAIAAGSGSIYLSVAMELKACPLCFYQRSFALASIQVLALILWLEGWSSPRAALVCLGLAVSGLGVAAFHVYLVQVGKLECPPGIMGWGDAPTQSLAVFLALTTTCLVGVQRGRQCERIPGMTTLVGIVVLGLLMAQGAIRSAPPLPPAPRQPYDPAKQPFDMCRPPYVAE